MEKQLKCILQLSLKDLALRRVAALLWSGSGTLASISKFRLEYFRAEEDEPGWWLVVEDDIKDKVSKLEIPKSLTKQLMDLVKPMSLDIRRWIEGHDEYLLDPCDVLVVPDLRQLCWTAEGSIDYRKTAEEIVRRDVLCDDLSYKLACYYCLEDYIILLWEKLPIYRREFYYSSKVRALDPAFWWPHILKGDFSELDYLLRAPDRNPLTFYQYAFENSAKNGYRTATEYFFCKLKTEERDDSLMRSTQAVLGTISDNFYSKEDVSKESIVSVLCYLLSVMTPVQRKEIFQSQPIDVLFSFLDWPFQDLFLENIGLFWTCLPPSSYSDLLCSMANRYTDSDFYLQKLYQELFIQSPPDFIKCLADQEHELNHSSACYFLFDLFRFQESETIGVIFRTMNAADRVKLVFQTHILEKFYYCMLKNGWRTVEVCLQESTLSADEKVRLEKAFREFLNSKYRGQVEWENENLKRFFEFLGETDVSVDKERKTKKLKLENYCATNLV